MWPVSDPCGLELLNALGAPDKLDKRDMEVVTDSTYCTDYPRLGMKLKLCRGEMDGVREERVLSCRLNTVVVAVLAF